MKKRKKAQTPRTFVLFPLHSNERIESGMKKKIIIIESNEVYAVCRIPRKSFTSLGFHLPSEMVTE